MWAQQKLEILYSATNRDWARNAQKKVAPKNFGKKNSTTIRKKLPKISVECLKIALIKISANKTARSARCCVSGLVLNWCIEVLPLKIFLLTVCVLYPIILCVIFKDDACNSTSFLSHVYIMNTISLTFYSFGLTNIKCGQESTFLPPIFILLAATYLLCLYYHRIFSEIAATLR